MSLVMSESIRETGSCWRPTPRFTESDWSVKMMIMIEMTVIIKVKVPLIVTSWKI